MRSSVRFLLLPVLLLLGSTLVACSSGDDDPQSTPTAKPTPLSAFDAAGMTIARTDFCDRIPDAAVEQAVGDVKDTSHYGNGEAAAVTGSVKDIAHEFSCTFTGTSGAVARVWVFVPQITRARAKVLVAGAGRQQGCRRVPGEGFGKPATGLFCQTKDGVEASYRGLFVDSWLTCSLNKPGGPSQQKAPQKAPQGEQQQELLDRTGEWCVQAVSAAATE